MHLTGNAFNGGWCKEYPLLPAVFMVEHEHASGPRVHKPLQRGRSGGADRALAASGGVVSALLSLGGAVSALLSLGRANNSGTFLERMP